MSLEQVTGDGFRFYRYDPEDGSEPVDLLSVTTIRSLCGESFNLVNWKMANLADAALGTMKRTVIGPRGGVKEVRQVAEFPCEFARMYDESEGKQDRIDSLRKWLRDQADEPRNIAAVRGTIVHEAIERDIQWDRIEAPYVEAAFGALSSRDQKKVKRAISDEDVNFVRNSVRHYWNMRTEVPMVILAREVRVVNLTAGYAGTFDALAWLLGTFDGPDGAFVPLSPEKQDEARHIRTEFIKARHVSDIGGTIVLLDWKTATGIHTDYVIQAHAYLAAEYAIVDGKRDDRLTALLNAALMGGLVHIRPNGWGVYMFPYKDETVLAFLGSVAFARFLAKYPDPKPIFTATFKGESSDDE